MTELTLFGRRVCLTHEDMNRGLVTIGESENDFLFLTVGIADTADVREQVQRGQRIERGAGLVRGPIGSGMLRVVGARP